ncbi:MAG TPA: 2-oxoglutarate dehydrogenase complex dihydrolipoyllysine-residue succinyltransferase [Opitutaceae bacterium]|nr:2-oxoglutarate dehydrogenase complex dihydrolipoyllysine-residue succinyltransferase [Opitutaceae bacterium]
MPIEVRIPQMGESISTGILAKWHVKDGERVKRDQPLFELETDKITSEAAAEAEGVITLMAPEGAEVRIGQVVASIEAGPGAAPPAAGAPAAAAPGSAPAPGPAPRQGGASPGPAVMSPAVRRLAEETGVDPASVAGTGRAGRVTKADMLSASAPKDAPAPPAASPGPRQTRRKLSQLRLRIAERLVSAQHDAASLTTFNEIDMSAVMELRSRHQEDFVKKNGLKLGFMPFFVKAVVQALKEVPAINAQLDGDTLVENHYFDIGVAVSTENGLMVPVIRGCDGLGMAGIEKAISDVAGRAREGRITLADLDGGVFTITNGGTYGSLLSTPIINPPQSAILGMHAINPRPVAVGGQVAIRPMMYVALTYDHRVVDGREAVTFLVKVKQGVEDPSRLLLGL